MIIHHLATVQAVHILVHRVARQVTQTVPAAHQVHRVSLNNHDLGHVTPAPFLVVLGVHHF